MKMKHIFALLISACLMVFSFTAYADDSPAKKESKLLSWLVVVNKNEISLSQLALKKASNVDVRNLAKAMIKDHNANLQKTLRVMRVNHLRLIKTDDVEDMQKEGKEAFAKLKSEKKDDFDKKYVETMVEGHNEVLDKLNKEISDLDANSKVTAHLTATRDVVGHHLEVAKSLQK